jgi:hypothetical protein
MEKDGRIRMLLVSLLGDECLETCGIAVLDRLFPGSERQARRISTKETNNKKALETTRRCDDTTWISLVAGCVFQLGRQARQ